MCVCCLSISVQMEIRTATCGQLWTWPSLSWWGWWVACWGRSSTAWTKAWPNIASDTSTQRPSLWGDCYVSCSHGDYSPSQDWTSRLSIENRTASIKVVLWKPDMKCDTNLLLLLFDRVLESLLVAMVTTVVIFAASMLLGECRELSSPTTHNTTVNISSLLRRDSTESTSGQWSLHGNKGLFSL